MYIFVAFFLCSFCFFFCVSRVFGSIDKKVFFGLATASLGMLSSIYRHSVCSLLFRTRVFLQQTIQYLLQVSEKAPHVRFY